jgi:putative heme-binding domain-containing protein
MLLLWNKPRMGAEAKGELSGVVYGSQNPLARLQALCTLEGMGAVTPEVLVAALGDEHWAVRRQAIRIAEKFENSPQVVDAAVKLAEDKDPRVRLQLAFSLGEWQDRPAGEALDVLAAQAKDPYATAAILSSATNHSDYVWPSPDGTDVSPLYTGLLAMTTAKKDSHSTALLLEGLLGRTRGTGFTAGQMTTVSRWLDDMASRGDSFEKLYNRIDVELGTRVDDAYGKLCDRAFVVAGDAGATVELRTAAVGLLLRRKDHAGEDLKRLSELLTPQVALQLQLAAVAAAARAAPEQAAPALLKHWPSYSPELRGAVVDVLLRNEVSAGKLVDAVEAKQIAAADIDLPRRQRLLNHKDAAVKARAAKLLAESAVAANRQKVLEAWRPVLSMKGDARRGAEVFRQNCAVCHRLGDVGQEVGPNLEAVREWTGEAVLTAILDPNRQTEPKYIAYTATTNSGETIYGVVASESGNAVTMKGLDGKERAVLRGDLKSLVSSNRTLMPDGFESSATKEQMADLIEFLKAPERGK